MIYMFHLTNIINYETHNTIHNPKNKTKKKNPNKTQTNTNLILNIVNNNKKHIKNI